MPGARICREIYAVEARLTGGATRLRGAAIDRRSAFRGSCVPTRTAPSRSHSRARDAARRSPTRSPRSTHAFPGFRFRIVDEQDAVRPHIKLFVDGVLVRDLAAPRRPARELMIVGALSGG